MEVIHLPTGRKINVRNDLTDARLKSMDCAIAPKLVKADDMAKRTEFQEEALATEMNDYFNGQADKQIRHQNQVNQNTIDLSKDLKLKKAIATVKNIPAEKRESFLKGEKRKSVLKYK